MKCTRGILIGVFCCVAAHGAEINATLVEARSHFVTHLIVSGKAPQEYGPAKPPTGVHEVWYPSGSLKLKAWVSDAPTGGEKHPAVLYLHGGFAFGAEDWRDAEPFQKAGFVVMVPMLRGENGNSGAFEMFYGEVDDAISAGRFLKALPYVENTNVFVAGHSVGGTLAQLVSMLSDEFRATASFSGAPNQKSFCKAWASLVPFDSNKPDEIRMRSPLEFPGSVRCPLFLYAGQTEDGYVNDNRLLASSAVKLKKPVTFTMMPGDHFTALKSETADAIKRFHECMTSAVDRPNSVR